MKKTFIYLVFIYLVLLVCCACSFGCKPAEAKKEPSLSSAQQDIANHEIVGLGRIEPEGKVVSLATAVTGIITEVYKRENDQILKGELILELEHTVQDAKMEQAKRRVITQLAEIRIAESNLEEQKVLLSNKELELGRIKNLYAKGAETRQNLDNLETDVKVCQVKTAQLQKQIVVSSARLKEAEQEADVFARELQQHFVKALGDGQIMDMKAIKGAALMANQSFAEFIPKGRLVATCEIDELFADKIREGQQAVIRQIGSHRILGKGKLIFASSALKRKSLFSEQAGDQEDRRVREVKILLNDQTGYLINSRVECIVQSKID
ncbi:HlyD family secretion protein [Pedobacter cryoconitis]|uniref:Multidrug resistance efflux pump n=1 Tax=Pedobacter cryoconitis TaxID=188932 RepID=A0A7X0MHP4_9SPHI|nr:biotin/lipoyl-binding protein [Pedobacter cryoconitis]MBB6499339.1 multidrug resistance efflux pump [Pedobacter cryoconitis]